jgi:hypothetical protein
MGEKGATAAVLLVGGIFFIAIGVLGFFVRFSDGYGTYICWGIGIAGIAMFVVGLALGTIRFLKWAIKD